MIKGWKIPIMGDHIQIPIHCFSFLSVNKKFKSCGWILIKCQEVGRALTEKTE